MGSGSLEIWVLWTSFQKSNIGWPQQPLIERVLIFDMNFHDSTKTFFFQNIKVKPNSRTWMTLKSSVVIFQTLEPQRPQWPLQPQQPQWPQWPQQPHFIKIFIQLDGWIIPSTQMTNTSPFFLNGSLKIQFFTDIWYSFCRRLLRPAYVIFLKTGWWNSNFQTSRTLYAS